MHTSLSVGSNKPQHLLSAYSYHPADKAMSPSDVSRYDMNIYRIDKMSGEADWGMGLISCLIMDTVYDASIDTVSGARS